MIHIYIHINDTYIHIYICIHTKFVHRLCKMETKLTFEKVYLSRFIMPAATTSVCVCIIHTYIHIHMCVRIIHIYIYVYTHVHQIHILTLQNGKRGDFREDVPVAIHHAVCDHVSENPRLFVGGAERGC